MSADYHSQASHSVYHDAAESQRSSQKSKFTKAFTGLSGVIPSLMPIPSDWRRVIACSWLPNIAKGASAAAGSVPILRRRNKNSFCAGWDPSIPCSAPRTIDYYDLATPDVSFDAIDSVAAASLESPPASLKGRRRSRSDPTCGARPPSCIASARFEYAPFHDFGNTLPVEDDFHCVTAKPRCERKVKWVDELARPYRPGELQEERYEREAMRHAASQREDAELKDYWMKRMEGATVALPDRTYCSLSFSSPGRRARTVDLYIDTSRGALECPPLDKCADYPDSPTSTCASLFTESLLESGETTPPTTPLTPTDASKSPWECQLYDPETACACPSTPPRPPLRRSSERSPIAAFVPFKVQDELPVKNYDETGAPESLSWIDDLRDACMLYTTIIAIVVTISLGGLITVLTYTIPVPSHLPFQIPLTSTTNNRPIKVDELD